MIPAVRTSGHAAPGAAVEVKLKSGFRYNSSKRGFESDSGKEFLPAGELPKNTRIVHKVPALAKAKLETLSKPEKELRQYVQVILPPGESPADYVETIRAWPGVEAAWVTPEISLPQMRQP